MDLHHNLFYSYRGPSTDEPDRERQLENNLTKALINTLEHTCETVWLHFLGELGIAGVPRGFLLQRRDIPGGASGKRHRVLLAISKQESIWSSCAEGGATYDSLPDAWIYGDGFAVLVESKVSGDFSPRQMDGHWRRLRSINGDPPRIKLMTWKEIHRLFGRFLPKLIDTASQLLVKQFMQFLEYSGMSGFTGFRREHFDYFVLHDDDDGRRWIVDQVEDLARQVVDILQKFTQFYESYDIGTLKRADSDCWVALGPRASYRKVTHQTLSLSATGLSIFVNSELKPATDRLKRVLSQSGELLRDAFLDLHLCVEGDALKKLS